MPAGIFFEGIADACALSYKAMSNVTFPPPYTPPQQAVQALRDAGYAVLRPQDRSFFYLRLSMDEVLVGATFLVLYLGMMVVLFLAMIPLTFVGTSSTPPPIRTWPWGSISPRRASRRSWCSPGWAAGYRWPCP